MAGRVNDVDVVFAVVDGGVLGQDGDAALLLQVIAVHHPLVHLLVVAERAGLPEKLVHQRGLAVVHVGDDSDVAKFAGHGAYPDRENRVF